ncbi:Clavaminate synthase-like protein [Crepidotus variabilis]|uniref:Clavaminate synthase-like protein n=1 Tax=Crepidotus variabilis TaxID=179855 RepID=A0A9P6JX10_9AGAR|nr:Clavaminate synthase-like protein [Crepidotus variabilis]
MVEYTPEGAVVISYPTLVASPESVLTSIEKGFGSDPNCLGIIVVKDLPKEYVHHREKLLKLAYHFGHLDEGIRESYTDPSSKYSFGWSHGKEIMNGKPDTLKGSYYANPVHLDLKASAEEKEEFPEYYGENIWPKADERGVEDFREAFIQLSELIYEVGCEMAIACQPFASTYLIDSTVSLSDLISKSRTVKARLLHYFPPSKNEAPPSDDDPVDSWCGFHKDHSMLTGLCSALFLRHKEDGTPEVIKPPSPTSGLYIRTRGGQLTRVSIPPDCLAFQTGEALEVATNGRLLATPHCVRVGSMTSTDEVSRESFALFMGPNTEVQISPTLTYGQFSKQIFSEHYESTM